MQKRRIGDALDQKVLAAALHGQGTGLAVGQSGQDDDRRAGPGGQDGIDGFGADAVGQSQIRQHDIENDGPGQGNGLGKGIDRRDVEKDVRAFGQQQGDDPRIAGIVFHQEDPDGRVLALLASSIHCPSPNCHCG